MSNVSIRLIRKSDIKFVYSLCNNEHWNYSRKMIERLVTYEPNGCFVATVNGKHVGQIFSINFGEVGWIGVLIVGKEHRRSGIGTLLMKQAMNYLLDLGVKTVRLEAVTEIADLYRKLGFVDEFDSLRFMRVNKKNNQLPNLNVEPLRENEIAEIAEFDLKYFGANRTRVLRQLYEDNKELCFISHLKSQIVGYVLCYEMEKGYRIGPWVCNPRYPPVARELVLKCVEAIEDNAKLYVGVPAINRRAIKILQGLDFQLYSRSIRMYFGKKLERQQAEGIFSISGPENG